MFYNIPTILEALVPSQVHFRYIFGQSHLTWHIYVQPFTPGFRVYSPVPSSPDNSNRCVTLNPVSIFLFPYGSPFSGL